MSVNPKEYIGSIAKVRFKYFNSNTKRMGFKVRPMLIIGAEKEYFPCDFNVLPISKISKSQHISSEYDIELNIDQCNKLSLHYCPSYIRVHKQSYAYSTDVDQNIISNLKQIDTELYNQIQSVHREFNDTLF